MQVQPYLFFDGRCGEALEFYRDAVGAKVEALMRFKDSPEPPPADCAPVGADKVMHASVRIGDSMLMITDECPSMDAYGPEKLGGVPVTIHLSVEDVDGSFARAVAAGATARMPVTEMFWGARYGVLQDPFGHSWSIATQVRNLTPDEIRAGLAAAMREPLAKSA
jgi:uncharacterized glyoxalase superfamily protein PhnB